MALLENATGTQVEVDATMKALRATIRPPEALSWISIGAQTGALTGVAANGTLFSFRNISANSVMIRRVGLGFVTTTAFTTAQMLSWGLFVARAYTTSDSGGTSIALTGNNGKHRTSLATPTSIDCRIASTGALTAGTRALDANALAQVGAWSGGQGTTLAPALATLFSHDPEDYPLILAQNEGITVANLTAMGAGGAGTLFISLELAETSVF